jgi:hypothetical protein
VNDLFAPATFLTSKAPDMLDDTDLDIEDRLNDSLVDALQDFKKHGAGTDSFNSGNNLLGVMSDSAMQDAGEVVSNFRSLYGDSKVHF